MAQYFLTNKAVEDLSKIWDYTNEVWSEGQADNYYGLLIGFCKRISENPNIGKNYIEIEKNIFGYKASQHVIFYGVIKLYEIEIFEVFARKNGFEV